MDFIGNETCGKLIWVSDEGYRNTNTIRKQGIPKSDIKKTYPSSTLGFGCSPPKDICDIFQKIWFHVHYKHIH